MNLESRPIDGSQHRCLLIPKLSSPGITNEGTTCQAALAQEHVKLYLAADLCPAEEALKKATIDVVSVMKCFPAVTSDEVVLAMAAWYTTLCHIDDAVEKLDFEVAQLALAHAMYILRTASPNDSPLAVGTIREGIPHDIFAARVLALAGAYCSQLKDLLPHTVQLELRNASVEAFEAMALENQWRRKSSIDESAYLSIRSKTIGVQPFFLLVQWQFDHESTLLTTNQELQSMMSDVAVASGFQNDLIGLKRDMEKGEGFNYILRLESPPSREREARTLKAIELHNNAVKRATDAWERLKAGTDTGAQACADGLLTFVERHYRWVSTSKRYQAEKAETKPSKRQAGRGLVAVRAIMAKTSIRKGLRHDSPTSVAPSETTRRRKSMISLLHGRTRSMVLRDASKVTK